MRFLWTASIALALLPPFLIVTPLSLTKTLTVDVLVVGATPGGVAAAVAAARAGARTQLVETRPRPGGIITWAWLTTFDLNLDPVSRQHLSRGLFLRYYYTLGASYDVFRAARLLEEDLAREPLLETTSHARPLRAVVDQGIVRGVMFEDTRTQNRFTVFANQVIDTTDDADVAALAGAPFVVGRPGPRGETWMQSATLVFRIGGIDWKRMAEYIYGRQRGGANGAYWGVAGRSFWGFPNVMERYVAQQPGLAAHGLNLSRQDDDSALINALQIFAVDGLDGASTAAGFGKGQRELPNLAAYLRNNVPGFDRSELVNHAPELYIRETRHIFGEYTLRAEDILSRRVFWDRAAVASYPIDIHAYRPEWKNPHPVRRFVYTIPFRAMVPFGIDNLVVASRAMSATSEAAGSARVIPTTMSMAHFAGVAAAFASRNDLTPRDLLRTPDFVRSIQRQFVEQGGYLGGPGHGHAAPAAGLDGVVTDTVQRRR